MMRELMRELMRDLMRELTREMMKNLRRVLGRELKNNDIIIKEGIWMRMELWRELRSRVQRRRELMRE